MDIKTASAIFALVAGIVVAFIALLIPPPGEIHESVLWFIAQLIMYTASIFGVSSLIDNKIFKNKNDTRTKE